MALKLDPFCFRQFDNPNYSGTKIPYDKSEFTKKLNELWIHSGKKLHPGYAPFCKHLIIKNFLPGIKVGNLPITKDNEHLLKSGYESRTPEELPVLTRWFSAADLKEIPEAVYLDVILYSKEQVEEENMAMSKQNQQQSEDYEWAIISIKGQLEDYELPMAPITMLRNALGKEYGGSGFPLDKREYLKSVEYWKAHALIQ